MALPLGLRKVDNADATPPSRLAYTAALRIPNFLQNLFGEGVLSGSFIPVYARLLAPGVARSSPGSPPPRTLLPTGR